MFNAVTNFGDQVNDDFHDTFAAIDNAERCAQLVGHAFFLGFERNEFFQTPLRKLQLHLADRLILQAKGADQLTFDALYFYLHSAYRLSKTLEELEKYCVAYRDDKLAFGHLIDVQHSVGPNLVFNLNSAREFLNAPFVLDTLAIKNKEAFENIFDKTLPFLSETRNSLSHQVDRSLVSFQGKAKDGRDYSKHSQRDGQIGVRFIGLRNNEFQQFEAEFSPRQIIELLHELNQLFASI